MGPRTNDITSPTLAQDWPPRAPAAVPASAETFHEVSARWAGVFGRETPASGLWPTGPNLEVLERRLVVERGEGAAVSLVELGLELDPVQTQRVQEALEHVHTEQSPPSPGGRRRRGSTPRAGCPS